MASITRFAPSPTGPLHLGHAYAAIVAHDLARAEGGRFLLRIEDIDQTRCKPEWEQAIYDDLHWLGLDWDDTPMRQSTRLPVYKAALDQLWSRDLLYPCSCTRRDIDAALGAPQEAATPGPDGPIYPRTCADRHCRGLPCSMSPRPNDQHLRLDIGQAAMACDHSVLRPGGGDWGLWFQETGPAHNGAIFCRRDAYSRDIGDVVLARKDFGTSYHLSVVLDDAAQRVTQVTRGDDLFAATPVHVLLQRLLNLPTPSYHHHRLIRDDQGNRLAKRDNARALSKYRAEGATPQDIRRLVSL